MSLSVGAPLTGTVVRLADVPDPVFAGQLVGAGVAVEPGSAPGLVTVRAPIAGTLVKAHPHAFIVAHDSGAAVLVHVGIDTVRLDGDGFQRHVAEGDAVEAGTPMVTYDPATVRERGLSAIVPVVVLDSAPDSVAVPRTGHPVAAGEPLYTWAG